MTVKKQTCAARRELRAAQVMMRNPSSGFRHSVLGTALAVPSRDREQVIPLLVSARMCNEARIFYGLIRTGLFESRRVNCSKRSGVPDFNLRRLIRLDIA